MPVVGSCTHTGRLSNLSEISMLVEHVCTIMFVIHSQSWHTYNAIHDAQIPPCPLLMGGHLPIYDHYYIGLCFFVVLVLVSITYVYYTTFLSWPIVSWFPPDCAWQTVVLLPSCSFPEVLSGFRPQWGWAAPNTDTMHSGHSSSPAWWSNWDKHLCQCSHCFPMETNGLPLYRTWQLQLLKNTTHSWTTGVSTCVNEA